MSNDNTTFSANARELREGETLSRSKRLEIVGLKPDKIKKTLAKMRNSMNQIASRAREATGRDFRVESGQFMTYDSTAVMLTCTLTCMQDEGEDDI